MLLETFKIIAMLCQISTGDNVNMTELKQAECHQFYVSCLQDEPNLEKCVEKRFIEVLTRPTM